MKGIKFSAVLWTISGAAAIASFITFFNAATCNNDTVEGVLTCVSLAQQRFYIGTAWAGVALGAVAMSFMQPKNSGSNNEPNQPDQSQRSEPTKTG